MKSCSQFPLSLFPFLSSSLSRVRQSYLALVVPYVRIGVCVVFITQWCEFLLELMKIFNYVKDRADQSEARVFGYVSTGLFVALTWSWIWLKLHLFVTKVLYA